jgi:hypothetical protein
MAALSPKLAAALAERLNAVVPKPLAVRREGTMVNVYNGLHLEGGTPASEIVDDNDGRSLAELARVASSAVVNRVQDMVAEALTEQWPLSPDGRMALAHTRTDAQLVYIWFGDVAAPVLELDPISIAELIR